MNLPPVADLLRDHNIRYVTNHINGKFKSNCPACKQPTTNLVELDADGEGFRCRCECGFSDAARLRSARAKPGGNGAPRDDADDYQREFEEAQREFEPEPEQEGEQNLEEAFAEARKEFPDDDETETETETETGSGSETETEAETERKPEPNPKPATIAEAARAYYERRKWKPVPIDRKEKKAIGTGWQKRDYNPAQFKDSTRNVGIQLGEVSGGLADVDLDCMEAIALAPKFLPPTDAIFGRKSKPASHRLYVTDLCETVVGARIAYPEYVGGKAGAMLVELRVGGKRKRKGKDKGEDADANGGEYEYAGAATVVPPSVHDSGETVAWVRDGEPAKVAGDALSAVVRKLAVAALLKRHYPGAGSRHDGALAIGGVLARAGWSAEDIGHVVEEVARAAGDDEVDDRVATAKGAVGADANGTDLAGLPKAREAWGDIVADTLGHWLKMRALRPDKGAGIEDRVALDFAAKHADDLRYIGKSGVWMRWTGIGGRRNPRPPSPSTRRASFAARLAMPEPKP